MDFMDDQEGFKVVLTGETNVGKNYSINILMGNSTHKTSLLNLLILEEKKLN